jgi:hypothetical protein
LSDGGDIVTPTRIRATLPVVLALATLFVVLAGRPWAFPDGRAGVAQHQSGCSCHSPDPSAGVSVSIQGPNAVAPGSTNSYTVTVSGPAGTQGGFDLESTGGTFIPGTGNKVLTGDLVHANPNSRSWTFQWTAPATAGTAQWYAVGLAADGSGTEDGDQWNFYGGAVSTPFTIQVNSLIGMDEPRVMRAQLGTPMPNPSREGMAVAYRMPMRAMAELSVIDARGARVCVLESGTRDSGMHMARWDGRGADGERVRPGVYFLCLRTRGEMHTTRILRTE